MRRYAIEWTFHSFYLPSPIHMHRWIVSYRWRWVAKLSLWFSSTGRSTLGSWSGRMIQGRFPKRDVYVPAGEPFPAAFSMVAASSFARSAEALGNQSH